MSEQRTMRDRISMFQRIALVVADALERQHEFLQGRMMIEPRSEQVTRAILSELREPNFEMEVEMLDAWATERGKNHPCEPEMLIGNGREMDVAWRAAIDAIRDEGGTRKGGWNSR